MSLPNFIIAGSGRAGTTSIFRYLSDHPDVCTSSIKETQFFIKHRNDAAEMLPLYESYFSQCEGHHKIIMEATPHYLKRGEDIAHTIANLLPGVKLLFILKNPVKGEISELTFDQFTDIAIKSSHQADESNLSEAEKRLRYYLNSVCHAKPIKHYYNNFPSKDMLITFYDDLKNDIFKFIVNISNFIDIDSSFFDSYNFTIQNKTRVYKKLKFHRMANSLNLFLESHLNQAHQIRKKLRTLYCYLDASKNKKHDIPREAEKKRINYFTPHNKELYQLLKKLHPSMNEPTRLAQCS